MAFIDTQLYIHQMISVKNFILAADVMKSISLLRYQEESKTLSLVSRVRRGLCRAVGAGGWWLARAVRLARAVLMALLSSGCQAPGGVQCGLHGGQRAAGLPG